MAVLIEAKDISNRDYHADYGTVVNVRYVGDKVTIMFKNKKEITVNKDTELMIEQGGRF